MDYKEFSKEKFDKLIQIQDSFKKQYDIDSYENWFYDSELGLLRLYNDDGSEIYFNYIPVGSFSQKAETWMWNWFNKSSHENNKEKLLIVKKFGNKHQYEKLMEGVFPSDEYDGWEFTSICVDLLNGIGGYRVESDGLYIYMVIISVEDKDSLKIKHFKQKAVECGDHGLSRPAFICQHLDLEDAKGFHEAFETYKEMELEEDDDFQAWCNECEKVRIEYDGWDEESEKFAQIKLVCENCYFELKEFNQDYLDGIF